MEAPPTIPCELSKGEIEVIYGAKKAVIIQFILDVLAFISGQSREMPTVPTCDITLNEIKALWGDKDGQLIHYIVSIFAYFLEYGADPQ